MYTPHFESIVTALNQLMEQFSYTKKDIGYGYRRTFDNGMRVDMIDYKKTGETIFRVSRGARVVKQYPIMYGYFDVVSKVIAKIRIIDSNTLEERHIASLLKFLNDAPRGVGVFAH